MAKIKKEVIEIKNDKLFLILRFPFEYTEKIHIFDSDYSSDSVEICFNKMNRKMHFQCLGKKYERISGFIPKRSLLSTMVAILENREETESIEIYFIKEELRRLIGEKNENRHMYHGKEWNREKHHHPQNGREK